MPDPETLRRWARKALAMPPRETVRLGYQRMHRSRRSALARRRDRVSSTYARTVSGGHRPHRFVVVPPLDVLAQHRRTLEALTALNLEHRFDLLGSGWVQVRHGIAAAGLEGYTYDPGPPFGDDSALARRANPANRDEVLRIRSAIDRHYVPIDWHLDFKSGYRWDEATWYRDIAYGQYPGADVKVPWELGRCQHLPRLALLAVLAEQDGDGVTAESLAAEFRNEILDFVAANPPRYGVQWVTAMDVAIRVSNWLMAFDLFAAVGHGFDDTFLDVFHRSIWEHGQHIASNLEWSDELRGNHYLADVVGMLFVGAYLPSTPLTDMWLRFACREVIDEIRLQFLGDGANFEGSTSYHRLAMELATYAVALMLALPQARIDTLSSATASGPPRLELPGEPLGPLSVVRYGVRRCPVPADVLDRLGRARMFSVDITKPNGNVLQVGDNDNGRFFNLIPTARLADGVWMEEHLDHRAAVAAVEGLLGAASGGLGDEPVARAVTSGLAKPPRPWAQLGKSQADHVRIGDEHSLRSFDRRVESLPADQVRAMRIAIPSLDPREGTHLLGYPAFGVYIVKSNRLFIAIRCGPTGQNGRGGHDHNDQLAVELMVDGVDWIRDPGTFVYTPLPAMRDAYRSARAHFVPQLEGPEPASLDDGVFQLGGGSRARCLYWGEKGFAGELQTADGRVALCRARLVDHALQITHAAERARLRPPPRKGEGWRAFLPTITYSPGYGILEP